MSHRKSRLFVAMVLLCSTTTAQAQDAPNYRHSLAPWLCREGTPPPFRPHPVPHTEARAGWPFSWKPHGEPSFRPEKTVGHYVGGGKAHGGEPRFREEGTWGWDDTGFKLFMPRVALLWGHGRHRQGGQGTYETDGLHVPDPIAASTATLQSMHGRRDEP